MMPTIDMAFPVQGRRIPVDHGYLLYAAVKNYLIVNGLHAAAAQLVGDRCLGILPIRGRLLAPGGLSLNTGSRVAFRVPPNQIGEYVHLSGAALRIGDYIIRLGVPSLHALRPLPSLRARIVTIRGFITPDAFLPAAWRQARDLGLSERVRLEVCHYDHGPRKGEPIRRVIRVKGKTIVGFAMRADHLDVHDSLLLQSNGLGGRRHMGCGIFIPWRARA